MRDLAGGEASRTNQADVGYSYTWLPIDVGSSRLGEQAIELGFDGSVALAGAALQSGAVEQCYMSAPIMNDAGLLQLAGSLRDTFATYSERVGNQFLSQ